MDALRRAEVLIVMLFAMVTLTAVARRLLLPYPIVLVLGGLVLGLVPGVPDIRLQPDLVFLVFLPPILWSAAYGTSFREFKENVGPIALLAFGLVVATTLAVAAVANSLLPGIGWPAAIALGAIVSPPDAAAATTMGRRLGLPRRIVVILEGESLVNDSGALILYRSAVAAAVVGGLVPGAAVLQFLYSTAVGTVVGVMVGAAAILMMRRIQDSFGEIGLSLIAPYAAWLLAERFHASAVLACVAGGIYLRQHFSEVAAPATRVHARAIWQQLVFLLNGVIFTLIGLQVGTLRETVLSGRMGSLLWKALAISLVVIAVRLLWVPLAIQLPARLFPALRAGESVPPRSHAFLVGWTGFRGVVSLAAALALPLETAAGQPFPYRAEIVVITFVVILVTLVLQGLSLPPIIRSLRLPPESLLAREEALARAHGATVALERLDHLARQANAGDEILARLREPYLERLQRLSPGPEGGARFPPEQDALYRRLREQVLAAERNALIELRDREVISDEVLHRLEHELNLEAVRAGMGEARLRRSD